MITYNFLMTHQPSSPAFLKRSFIVYNITDVFFIAHPVSRIPVL